MSKAVTDKDACDAESFLQYLFQNEVKFHVNGDYMKLQADLSPSMREILVDWLLAVHDKYRMHEKILFRTIQYIDRSLCKRSVTRNHFQLLGCVCLLLASKFEDNSSTIEIDELVTVSDKSFTRDHVRSMEVIILQSLDFCLSNATCYSFFEEWNEIIKCTCCACWKWTKYLLELSLLKISNTVFLPSEMAASVMCIVHSDAGRMYTKCTSNKDEIVKHLEKKKKEEIITQLREQRATYVNAQSKYDFVHTKWQQAEHLKVADWDF